MRISDWSSDVFSFDLSLFSSNKPKEAETYFNKVSTSPTYGSQAKSYLGYIAYQEDDYATATHRFDQITDQTVLDAKLYYYQADRKRVVSGYSVSVRVDICGRGVIKKQRTDNKR